MAVGEQGLAGDLGELRRAVGALRPQRMAGEQLPALRADVAALATDVSRHAEALFAVVDAIQADAGLATAAMNRHLTTLLEACQIADVTSQRASRIGEALAEIEARMHDLCAQGVPDAGPAQETAAERRRRLLLLNGPGVDGPETAQGAIDQVFG